MVDHFSCLQLAAFESSLVILGAIFCVYKLGSLSRFLHHSNLGILETQSSVLFTTLEGKAHTIEQVFQVKLVGHRGAPELELLAVVIVLFAPILHETLTNSNSDTNTICQLSHSSSFKCRELKSISQQKCFADCFTDWHNILNEDVHVTVCLSRSFALRASI